MYRKSSPQLSLEDEFFHPFGGALSADNRWVILAKSIPWDAIEDKYASLFSDVGQPAKPIRMAVGALILKEKCRLSDEELVQQIMENSYFQYFLGLKTFQQTPLFDSSVLVKWRRRFNDKVLADINEMIVAAQKPKKPKKPDPPPSGEPPGDGGDGGGQNENADGKNQGKLLIDATCAPADIKYPTDLSLLNDSREKLEEIIDTLHKPLTGKQKKPRTYRKKARKAYLTVAKQKRPQKQILRKAVGKQLRFVARNLKIVEHLQKNPEAGQLAPRQKKLLAVIGNLYAQQSIMYKNRTHQVEDRIVSIYQPHVRPIIRGKAKAFTEFGAKVEVSLVNGYSFLETLSWDAFHEGIGLPAAIERYHARYGCYPEAVLADRIYRTRDNLAYCKEKKIRLSGPKLGRPVKVQGAAKRIAYQDNRERNAIEGKFGEGKRRYGLNRIMARLKETSASVIAMQFLVTNLEKILRDFFAPFWDLLISAVWGNFNQNHCISV